MNEVPDENIVLEGFLCPICKVDFGLDLKLYLHFQEAHGEDQDLVKSFKGRRISVVTRPRKCTFIFNYLLHFDIDLFGKAKEKILKNDLVRKERQYVWEPQEIGKHYLN